MSLVSPGVAAQETDKSNPAPAPEDTPLPNAHQKKPTVLFITPTRPQLSSKGGAMRAGMNILALARIFQVHVLVLSRFGAEPDMTPEPELADKMASITVIDVLAPQQGAATSGPSNLDILKSLIARPRSALRFPNHDINAVLKPLSGQKFDLIFFCRLATGTLMDSAAFRKWAGNTPRILDIDDIESETARREARVIGLQKGRVGHLVDLLDVAKLTTIERRMFRKFDNILVCSDGDRVKMAQQHRNIRFAMLPNGFQVPPSLADRCEPDMLTLLFVGSLQYPPNEEGLLSFCANVLPPLREKLKHPFRFMVVGRNPSQKLLDLEEVPEITIRANVPDVSPFYQSATMAIVPINFGGGTRIKILEAMALGCPVVSTTLGAEGLQVRDGESILLADGAKALTDACLRLAQDQTLRENLVHSGWDVVRSLYSVEAVANYMADCVKAASDTFQQLV